MQTTSAQTIVGYRVSYRHLIVFINREPEKAVLDSYAGKCCYVGADARQSGTYQGELILETETKGDINGDGKVTLHYVQGRPPRTSTLSTAPSVLHQGLTDAGMEVECLYEYLDNWDQTHGTAGRCKTPWHKVRRQDRGRLLQQRCYGSGRSAVPAAGWPHRGQGCSTWWASMLCLRLCRNVVDGNMTGTVLNDDVGQATAAADATKLYVDGKDVEQYYWVDYVKVTKENAAEYLEVRDKGGTPAFTLSQVDCAVDP